MTTASGSAASIAPSRLQMWWQSLRAPTLLTSVVPAAAGGLTAIGTPHPDWWLMALALLALLCVHAGTNISNDVEDAARGVDSPDKTRRNSRVFNTGRLSIGHGRRLYGACFAAGLTLGVVIAAVQGPALLVIGVIGLLGGLLYTAGPMPYKYLGLGEPAIVLLMGPLMTAGIRTATTGTTFAAAGFWVGIGPGLLIACVLAANNLDDLADDRAVGARTLPVRLGFARGRWLYGGMMLVVVPAEIALWASGLFDAWILLPLVLSPVLLVRAREVVTLPGEDDPRLHSLTPRTGAVHLWFSVLLCAAVVLARVL